MSYRDKYIDGQRADTHWFSLVNQARGELELLKSRNPLPVGVSEEEIVLTMAYVRFLNKFKPFLQPAQIKRGMAPQANVPEGGIAHALHWLRKCDYSPILK